MKSSDTAEVFFDDVRVPCKNLIGQEGMGFTYQMLQFQEERLWAVANSESVFISLLPLSLRFSDIIFPTFVFLFTLSFTLTFSSVLPRFSFAWYTSYRNVYK